MIVNFTFKTSLKMKTKLLRKLRNKIPSIFQVWVERNPIDVRNDILSEVYRIRKRKNIKPKALYTNDFGEKNVQVL